MQRYVPLYDVSGHFGIMQSRQGPHRTVDISLLEFADDGRVILQIGIANACIALSLPHRQQHFDDAFKGNPPPQKTLSGSVYTYCNVEIV